MLAHGYMVEGCVVFRTARQPNTGRDGARRRGYVEGEGLYEMLGWVMNE